MRETLKKCLYTIILVPFFMTGTIESYPAPTNDFRELAKTAIPAVVSVKVQGKTNANNTNPLNNPSLQDQFGNDFWQRFFGLPRGQNQFSQPFVGQASGFVVSPDGYILTNDHVVTGADVIMVTLDDGREIKAKVIGEDPHSDLAVIKIDAENLPFLKLGNSDQLDVGEWVAAIGNPLGLQATLTVGIVSAKGRNHLDLAQYEDYIQTDAAINRGNSGGPLLTMDGNVVGINTAIATNSGSGGYMGIGFAIPSNMAKLVMDQLISSGKVTRGFLGVTLQKVDSNLAQAFNLNKAEGALIADVSKDSPAEKAGLKQGDIILKFNNQTVDSIVTLRNAISFMKPGSNINLIVLRNEKQMEIPVEVGNMDEKGPLTQTGPINSKLGIDVQNLTSEIAASLGYSNDTGVVVTKVASGSVAELAGIKQGALIVAVNKQKVNTVEEYKNLIGSTEKGKPVLLLVKQGNNMYFVSLKTE